MDKITHPVCAEHWIRSGFSVELMPLLHSHKDKRSFDMWYNYKKVVGGF